MPTNTPKAGDTCPHCGGEVVEQRGKWIVIECGECGFIFAELDYPDADRDEQMVRY